MTRKKAESITLSVPVETARILYTILEYAPIVEQALVSEKIVKKFSPAYKKRMLELYDDLGFKLSMEMWS